MFAECVQENGEKYLWYNITGKQALDAVLETETLSYDMLCNVLNGIYEAVQQLEGMLLPAQSILLSAESIFVDYRTRQIFSAIIRGIQCRCRKPSGRSWNIC